MLTYGILANIMSPKTIDYDKNTEIAHDSSLLLVVEKISPQRNDSFGLSIEKNESYFIKSKRNPST